MRFYLCVAALLACGLALGDAPVDIRVDNEARVPAAELESVLKDFSAWAQKVYRYNQVQEPEPVTLRLTRSVPFGFYNDGVVMLPPSKDRGEMIENWVHELAHHATGQDSSFFFKEGIAVHTLEAVFALERRLPQGFPQYGRSVDQWVSLYVNRGQYLPLKQALAWSRYRGDTPENDFRSWQIYNQAGSFVGWYIARHGYAAFRKSFAREWPSVDAAQAEQEWLAALRAKKLPVFDPAKALPDSARYRAYVARLRGG